MSKIWTDKKFNYYLLGTMNFSFFVFFLYLFVNALIQGIGLPKALFWLLFTIISFIGIIANGRIPRASITETGIWTGDLFIKNNKIIHSKSILIPWNEVKNIGIKQKDIDSFKKTEMKLIINVTSSTVHIPTIVRTKTKEYQFLIYNYNGFIKCLKKLSKDIRIT